MNYTTNNNIKGTKDKGAAGFMNINHIVWIRSSWFAEIKTWMIIGERRPMRLSFAH